MIGFVDVMAFSFEVANFFTEHDCSSDLLYLNILFLYSILFLVFFEDIIVWCLYGMVFFN